MLRPKKLGFLASRYVVSKGVRETTTRVLRRQILGMSAYQNLRNLISGKSGNQENRVGVLSTPISGITRMQGNRPR